jgi:hypothetical protein
VACWRGPAAHGGPEDGEEQRGAELLDAELAHALHEALSITTTTIVLHLHGPSM